MFILMYQGQHIMLLGTLLSNIINATSMITWICVFIPQMLTNIKNKSASAISFHFLFYLLMGDLFSIQSANNLTVNKIIVYNGWMHVIIDFLLITQWFYYSYEVYTDTHETTLLLSYNVASQPRKVIKNELLLMVGILFQIGLSVCLHLLNTYKATLAVILGWCATGIFFLSRIPQIYKIHKRKNVEGLSLTTFALFSTANNLFLISIFIEIIDITDKKRFLIMNVQWITGIILSNIVDVIILYQFYKYKPISNHIA